MICDPSVLKHGVRYIYALNGSLVTDINQLEEGHSYVCSSSPVYKRLDYRSISRVGWVSTRKVSTPAVIKPSESYLAQFSHRHPHQRNGIFTPAESSESVM